MTPEICTHCGQAIGTQQEVERLNRKAEKIEREKAAAVKTAEAAEKSLETLKTESSDMIAKLYGQLQAAERVLKGESKMKREIRFFPAFDKRSSDPKKDYGIHGVNLLFLLKGEKGVIQFLIYTNWQLPHVQREVDACSPSLSFPYLHHQPMAADIGYHSPVPMYEGQDMMTDKCEYLDGKPCYYDGSGLRAQKFFDVLRKEGDEGLWRALEDEYKSRFEEE